MTENLMENPIHIVKTVNENDKKRMMSKYLGRYQYLNREVPDKLPCTICPKVFCNKYYLKHHIRSHTEKTEKAKEKAICSVCSKLLIRDFMGEHMRNIHGENKHVPCNNCGSNYRLSSIKRHQKFCKRTEEERKARKAAIAQKCDRCGKFLCNIFKLRKHMKICVQ